MELEFLGTGSGVPAKHRNVSSLALNLMAEHKSVWLFDCGEGTQMQILNTTIRPRNIKKIFITHLHGDHIFGLPGLLSSRSFQEGVEPLEIYGPKGVEEFIRTALRLSQTRLGYQLIFTEVEDKDCVFEDQHFAVYCKKLDHGIASYGYRVVEKDLDGQLQVEKLAALGIKPGPVYGKIKRGEMVTLEDGTVVNGQDFVGPMKKGRIVTILGDTRFTPNAIELARGADVLVHESTFQKSEAKKARAYHHSTTEQAATVAKEAGVQQLILTHISARYLAKEVQMLVAEAREVFPQTRIAKDFDCFEIAFREGE